MSAHLLAWSFVRFLKYTVDCFFLLWYFGKAKTSEIISPGRLFLAIFSLLGLMPLYFTALIAKISYFHTYFFIFSLRFLWRFACVFCFLMMGKRARVGNAAYHAGLYTICYHIHLVLFSAPGLVKVANYTVSFTGNQTVNTILCLLIFYAAAALIVLFLRSSISFQMREMIGAARTTLLAATAICTLYDRAIFQRYLYGGYNDTSVSVLVVLVQILLLAAIVFVERNIRMQRQLESEYVQDVANAYELKGLRAIQMEQESVRALVHDTKNHLLTIRRLARNGDGEKIVQYVSDILEDYGARKKSVETGNVLIDGLISEKVEEARQNGIDIHVILDSRNFGFISDVDLCTIFSNALDNAIEACGHVESSGGRYIRIRGGITAGYAAVVFANSYVGELNMDTEDGLPGSTKTAPMHGIGLRNIRRALLKYDGELHIDTEKDGEFSLTVVLPVPKQ